MPPASVPQKGEPVANSNTDHAAQKATRAMRRHSGRKNGWFWSWIN